MRNTAFVAGIVAYAGSDTKIMQNANVTPSKRSRIDRIVNKSIFVIFITLLVLCIANASAWMMWRAESASDGWCVRSGCLVPGQRQQVHHTLLV